MAAALDDEPTNRIDQLEATVPPPNQGRMGEFFREEPAKGRMPDESIVYFENDSILIRRYEPHDQAGVHQVFANSMGSLIDMAMKDFVQQSPQIFVGGTLVGAIVIYMVVGSLTHWALDPEHWNNGGSLTTFLTPSIACHVMASIAALFLMAWSYRYLKQDTIYLFHQFIHHSLQADLSQIDQVYFPHQGTFLVAVDKASNRIVGCVGGQYRSLATNDNDDKKKNTKVVYELRRMVVDPAFHGRSVGRRLVQCLQQSLGTELPPSPPGAISSSFLSSSSSSSSSSSVSSSYSSSSSFQIFLTCSNIQRPAHKLYEKCGFVRTQTLPEPGLTRGWLRWTFWLYRYEKECTHVLEQEPTPPTTTTTSTTTKNTTPSKPTMR